ncbi:MAG: DUF1553 domain-containing protein [Planctomycetota bacterium]
MKAFSGRKLFYGLLLVIGVLQLTTASHAEVSYNEQVRPILSDRCFKCHGPDAANQESDFRVDTFANATADLGGYAGIVPGDPDESEMLFRIHDTDDPMPPVGSTKPLTEAEKEILTQWIRQGAGFESHWAFTPLPKQIDIPEITSLGDLADWQKGPIDQFIAARLLEEGLSPADAAPKAKWLRRVTFDLTGLPPTEQEIGNYLIDQSPSAEKVVVERLLNSDAYAERLTSEWLDIARYADSYGYQRDDERFVWPYRDWVINAFKDGMPYDQFITWQLAGDLLPNPTREQRLATTFNRLHSHKKEGGVAIEEFRVENVADRTHTVGTAMLGLTMECCRCHDHKYDPLPTKDYYAFSAFFDNIDENGLISYFTDAVPTPAMPLPNEEQAAELSRLRTMLVEAEHQFDKETELVAGTAFESWLQEPAKQTELPGLVAALDFDTSLEVFKPSKKDAAEKVVDPKRFALQNSQGDNAITSSANQLVMGRRGNAVQFTGDDPVEIPNVGHFKRHDSFSFSLWMWSPESENRSVIYRRSRGWHDAGSVGYELTREGSKLSAKLCHFWPGDAIAVETEQPITAKQWLHVVVTYDGSSKASGLKIFVDGEPAKLRIVEDHLTRTITNWGKSYEKNDHHDLALGSRYRDRGFVGGRIDDLKVFDREISPIEVAQLYDNESLTELLATSHQELTDQQRDRLRDYFVLAVDDAMYGHRASLRASRAALNEHMDTVPAIMVMRENESPRQTYVLDRGVYDAKGEPVDPNTPSVLPPMTDAMPRNRLGLAQWMTSPDHPLTARVAVNRYWQLMFGYGLVRTPEDFGNQGENPTHPELLDWLSRDFVSSGWNVRELLRKIALSATYRQSSVVSASTRSRDPENRFLARGTGMRLSAEMIRDNALATSGLLNPEIGGQPVKPYDLAVAYNPLKVDQGENLYRRSLYTFWKRTSPAPVMMTLNTPMRAVCRMKREITDTPLQALVLLNGPQFVESARVMAADLFDRYGESPPEIARNAFLRLTSRPPTEPEINILLEMYQQQMELFADDPESTQAFLSVGQATVNSDASAADLAAATVLINSIMNLDECVRHQ